MRFIVITNRIKALTSRGDSTEAKRGASDPLKRTRVAMGWSRVRNDVKGTRSGSEGLIEQRPQVSRSRQVDRDDGARMYDSGNWS